MSSLLESKKVRERTNKIILRFSLLPKGEIVMGMFVAEVDRDDCLPCRYYYRMLVVCLEVEYIVDVASVLLCSCTSVQREAYEE